MSPWAVKYKPRFLNDEQNYEVSTEKISFKKLDKMIKKQHPIDPDTQEKFDIFESVTVKNFGVKMCGASSC